MRIRFSFWLVPLAALLAACAQQPPLPGTKTGKPYVVGHNLYFPSYDDTYDKIGEASWYGPGFNGRKTASGEVFNQNDLTAAHPTLPMPSLVRVTNLRNGKSLIVRINDRGPFASNRIIDLSKRAAHDLGISSIAQVRVQFLKAQTEDYIARSETAGHPISMAFYNEAAEPVRETAMPSAAPPPAQIVESDVHETHAGDTVTPIAPVMTVSSSNLKSSADTNLADKDGHPVRSIGLMRQAWADDNVTLPDPPAVRESAPPPAPVKKHAAGKTPAEKLSAVIIQAGSFSTQKNAQKLAAALAGIAPITVDEVAMGGRHWWRVRLGPFSSKAEAGSALAKARAHGVADARITHQ